MLCGNDNMRIHTQPVLVQTGAEIWATVKPEKESKSISDGARSDISSDA